MNQPAGRRVGCLGLASQWGVCFQAARLPLVAQAGYGNVSAFIEAFARQFGATPGQYLQARSCDGVAVGI